MLKPLMIAHYVVKNEDRFIWYSISSIMNYVNKILITDTGSDDQTVKIIKSFNNQKIEFRQQKNKTATELAILRQQQIEATATDWLWVVDGDEVYPNILCQEIVETIKSKGSELHGIVVGRYDLMGDIYHYQHESVGAYHMFDKVGHLVLRLINKKNIPKLHIEGVYPNEGYYDQQGLEIIHHPKEKFYLTKNRIFHAMYLPRSSIGANLDNTLHRHKYKIEKGIEFKNPALIPEVFFVKRPSFVADVTLSRGKIYEILAAIITPIKKLKRLIIKVRTYTLSF